MAWNNERSILSISSSHESAEIKLNMLNEAIEEIDNLNAEFLNYAEQFKMTEQSIRQKLKVLNENNRDLIEKTRGFFHLIERGRECKTELVRVAWNKREAAREYEEACANVAVAERIIETATTSAQCGILDSHMLLAMNTSTEKVMRCKEAEEQLRRDEQNNLQQLADIDYQLSLVTKQLNKKDVDKARKYSEEKRRLQQAAVESGMKARNAYRKLVNVKLAHQQLFEQLERQSLLPKETNTWNLSDCEECVFADQQQIASIFNINSTQTRDKSTLHFETTQQQTINNSDMTCEEGLISANEIKNNVAKNTKPSNYSIFATWADTLSEYHQFSLNEDAFRQAILADKNYMLCSENFDNDNNKFSTD